MTRAITTFVILIALSGVPVHAADSPQTAEDGFAPIAFMAGSCWQGPLPGFVAESTGVGERTVTHCVRWRMGGTLMTDTLYLDGLDPPVRGETNYYWDPDSKVLRYIFFSLSGSYSTGTMRAEGKTMIFDDEELLGGSRDVVRFVTTWTPVDAMTDGIPDAFIQNRQRENADGTWTDSEEGRFERRPLR